MITDHLHLRIATSADAGLIRELVRAAYAKWVPLIGREPRPMLADYDQAVREHRIDLLFLADYMVGLIETLLLHEHLWIENVAVSPDAQGRGYGRHLLAHAEQLAVASARPEIRMLTNAAFTANVQLYQRVGYVIARSEPFMGGTTLHLRKAMPHRSG
jgi:ribosomal protein S18 acetylase RimI-like enzyme